ncbi:hypothetical protein, partial [Streptococcus pneumoniae]|uniref:hypothetical protein n=1 Tax=Streptococcus pneumoniae TaxID=1313 RepID=UPI001260309D
MLEVNRIALSKPVAGLSDTSIVFAVPAPDGAYFELRHPNPNGSFLVEIEQPFICGLLGFVCPTFWNMDNIS